MNFRYVNGKYPDHPALLQTLEQAANRLHGILTQIDPENIGLSPYGRKYLRSYLSNPLGHLTRAAYVLAWGLHLTGKDAGQVTLLDHGAGIGVLSFFAKLAGVRRIIYTDYHSGMRDDALAISTAIQISLDRWELGELAEIRDRLLPDRDYPDLLISSDVIEHVYDIFGLFDQLPSLNPGKLAVAMETSANAANPWIAYKLRKIHRVRESFGRGDDGESKQGVSFESYLEVRVRIIREAASGFSDATVAQLAGLTRGMRRDDIIAAAIRYRDSGQLPPPPAHPSNTCDPMTGSWEEHLIAAKDYRTALEAAGFRARVLPGYYEGRVFGGGSGTKPAKSAGDVSNRLRRGLKRTAIRITNRTLATLGQYGLPLAKFILLTGVKPAGNRTDGA